MRESRFTALLLCTGLSLSAPCALAMKTDCPDALESSAIAVQESLAASDAWIPADAERALWVKGDRFETLARQSDPDFGGYRLFAEITARDALLVAEGRGFSNVGMFSALLSRLGIEILPARSGSPAISAPTKFRDAEGFRLIYPDVISLNARLRALRGPQSPAFLYEPVSGDLGAFSFVKLLAQGKLPYAQEGSFHYHDIQVHLVGAQSLPAFWWRALRDRAVFVAALAENEEIMVDPEIRFAVYEMVSSVGYGVERLSADILGDPSLFLPGLSQARARSRMERAEKISDFLRAGGTGGDYPTKGSASLAQQLIKKMQTPDRDGKLPVSPEMLTKLRRVLGELKLEENPVFPHPLRIIEEMEANLLIPPQL